MAKKNKLTKSKAAEILHDKTAHGHPLTDKQRKFFAAKAFADIGVSLPNYNESQVSVPPGFVGQGNTTKGFNYNGAWGGTMQDGGQVNIDSVLNANRDKDFVKRLFEKDTPSIKKGGQTMTHFMESSDGIVYPRVVRTPKGEMKFLSSDKAYKYAQKTGEFIQFPNDEQAQYFGKNYKQGVNVLKDYEMGGSMPGLTGAMYARIGAPSNGPGAKKTKASAKNGKKMPLGGMLPGGPEGPSPASDMSVAGSRKMTIADLKQSRAIPTNQYNSNNLRGYKVPVNEAALLFGQKPKRADDTMVHVWSAKSPSELLYEKQHPGVPVATTDIFGNRATAVHPQGANVNNFQDGGQVSPYYIHGNDFKTKGMQQGGAMPFDVNALKARNAKRDSVRNALYQKYNKPGEYHKINDAMLEYFQQEKPIHDNQGQYNHPGKVTKIDSNKITMQGVPYPVLGVSDVGHTQIMHPGGEYAYDGSTVTEYPILASGGDVQNQGQLKNLNQLIDFTNNNHMEQAKSGIHIKPSHKGRFTAYKKRTGKTTEEALHSKDPHVRQMANFAKNAKKWKHEDGGLIPYAQQGFTMDEVAPQGSTPVNLASVATPQQQFPPVQQAPNINAGPSQTFGQDNSGSATPASSNVPGISGIGGVGGAMDLAGGVIKGLKMLKQEKVQAQQSKQNAALTNVVANAASTRPEKVKRKYTRPEDIAIQPEQMFPTYGVGTNYLAKNGTEIQNTYAPTNTLYDDLGYEPLDDSNVKQFQIGGIISSVGAGQAGNIGSVLGSSLGGGNFTTNPNGGSMIGSSVGGALGNALFPGVGGIVGKFAGGLVGGALDRKGRDISKYNNQASQNMNRTAIQESAQNLQSQNTSFMEDGGRLDQAGNLSHIWQPQVITKFGEHSLKELLKPDPMMDTFRSGGHLKDEWYTPPSARALQTYALGGELETHWGGKAEPMSYNPYLPDGGETVMFKGQSHDESDGKGNSGIGVTFGNSPVEVERGEPAVKLQDGGTGGNNLVVFGNMRIPSYGAAELGDKDAKGRKFKSYVTDLSNQEAKQNKVVEKGTKLVNDDVHTSFDMLKMNSGKLLMEGGNMKLKNIAKKKEAAAMVQNAILEAAQEHGIDSDALSQGKIKKAKMGGKFSMAQNGKTAAANIWDNLFGSFEDTPEKRAELESKGFKPTAKPQVLKKTSSAKEALAPNKTDVIEKDIPKYMREKMAHYLQSGVTPEELVAAGKIAKKDVPEAMKYYNPNAGKSQYATLHKGLDLSIPQYRPDINMNVKGGPNMTPITTEKGGYDGVEPTAKGRGFNPGDLAQLIPYFRPTNKMGLDPNQLAGEYYALANNQLDPVNAQLYHPQLDQPYDISLQDQLNANQSDFNAIQKQTGYSPAAQAALAAQKYAANSGVLGEQFRQNQGEKARVYGKNRDILNDAQLKNLSILDQQYVRQSQAKSNTKAIAQSALSSIADKIQQNKLENRTLGVYENLYNYRYDNEGRAYNLNQPIDFQQMIDNVKSTVADKKKARNGSIVKAIKNL